jgi:ABC-type transporter Mla MlaB component
LAAASNTQPEPDTPLLIVGSAIRARDVPRLCHGLARADQRSRPVVCDVAAVAPVDLTTVDGLARLALTLRRLGHEVVLRNASEELRDLVALAGLVDVLPCSPGSGVEARREPEQREVARGVEEERDPADRAI